MNPHPLMVQLADERRRQGLLPASVAAIAGLHRSTIVRYEAGTKDPRLSNLEGLAGALRLQITLLPLADRVCSICREQKRSREFPRDARTADGRAPYCLACREEGAVEWDALRTGAGRTNNERAVERDQRVLAYLQHRVDGYGVAEAARRTGIGLRTGQRYEKRLQTIQHPAQVA